ncbi:MAG: antirestriction protein, partial [Gammaproteobacteria bacterium]|nr:antirestriction protein [Gammaproteobacteria bacterium]
MTSSTHTYTGYYDPTTGKGHSGQMMKIGQNLQQMVYWTSSFPLINVIKGGYTSNSAIPGTLDAQGYPDASGGGSWNHYTHSEGTGFMNEGTVDEPWVLRWEGTGNVTWNGGTEIPGSTPNRREYTSLAAPDGIYWTHATGDVTNLELLAPGEEARYDAGNIVHSRFVADLAGIDSVRMLQSLTDDNGNRDVSDFTPYDYIDWDGRISPNGLTRVFRGLPTQAACEIANELGVKNFHYNVPHQVTDAAATYIGQQIALHFDFSGKKVKIELGNEIWNMGPGFKDAWSWYLYGESPVQEGTFDHVTATCTS